MAGPIKKELFLRLPLPHIQYPRGVQVPAENDLVVRDMDLLKEYNETGKFVKQIIDICMVLFLLSVVTGHNSLESIQPDI